VLQESDFFYGHDKPMADTTHQSTPSEDQSNPCDEELKSLNSKQSQEENIELLQYPRRISDCATIDSKPPCWIKVVSESQQSSSSSDNVRYVEGYCSICLLEFEAGDVFLSSTRRVCHHGFHQECALTWLATGKKRCPVCRNYFVPQSRIDDIEVIQHKEDDIEAYRIPFPTSSLYDAYQMDEVLQHHHHSSTCCDSLAPDEDQDRDDPLPLSRKSSLLSSSRDHITDRLDQSGSSDGTRRSFRGRAICQIHPL
jgi:hypothetical protein